LRKFTRAELGVVPLHGAFSKYLNSHETSILYALIASVAPRVMIEFGCHEGITAKRMLENLPTLQKYIGIDVPHGHRATLRCQQDETPADAGWYAAADPRFFLLLARSQMLRTGHLESCDAVFIDGDHSEHAVLHESRLARRLIRGPVGMIVWHDYSNPAVEVTQALDQLCYEGWPINCVEDSWLAFMSVEKTDADPSARKR
jgi:predicted O-methyltransferase YrrM